MIRLVYSESFLKSAKRLPKEKQIKLAELLVVISDNPYNPKLHTKRLGGDLAGFFSFRITRDWRVIFQFIRADAINLLRVKHRKDAYRR